MSYRNAARRRQTKGVVLFTVVAIMLFLMVMVMATLSVVSSAQKRTYTKFKENQAYFTARSGIATFLKGAAEEDETSPLMGLHDEFKDLCQSNTIYNDSGKSFTQLEADNPGMEMTISFPQPPESGGDLKYLYGDCKVIAYKIAADKAKIVSRAAIGGTESIITLYVSVPKSKPQIFETGMLSFSNLSNNHTSVLGSLSTQADPAANSKSDPGKAACNTTYFQNEGVVSRNVTVGSGAYIQNQSAYVFTEKIGNRKPDDTYEEGSEPIGFTAMGDLHIQNNAIFYGSSSAKRPYIYADGCLTAPNGVKIGASIGSGIDVSNVPGLNGAYGDLSDDPASKINVYCNSASLGTVQINGDLYIYGEDEDTDFAYMTSEGKNKSNEFNGIIYGDIYCNGDLALGNNAEIHGSVYCTGNLTYNDSVVASVDGTLEAETHNGIGVSDGLTETNTVKVYNDYPVEAGLDTGGQYTKTNVKANIIKNPSEQYNNYIGEEGDPDVIAGMLYPAFGYYTNDEGELAVRETVDDSWSIWNPSDYFNTDGQVAFLDATENNLNIVVNNGLFPQNRKNCKLVVVGDKRVDFYFTEKAPNPWWAGDDTKYVKTTSGGGDGTKNMVITKAVYDAMSLNQEVHIASPSYNDNITVNIYYNIQDNLKFDMCSDLLMGYIYGPKATAVLNNGVDFPDVVYDDVKYTNVPNLNFIGALVTSDIDTSNNIQGIFLPPAAPNNEMNGKFWTDLYYLNY